MEIKTRFILIVFLECSKKIIRPECSDIAFIQITVKM